MTSMIGRESLPLAGILLFFLFSMPEEELLAQQQRPLILHDSVRNREARQAYRAEREGWMRMMHRAAPGLDVEIINDGLRRARRLRDRNKGVSPAAVDSFIEFGHRLRGSWQERGSRNQAGRTMVAAIDTVDDQIYVVADGGQLWRGGLDGTGWTSLDDQLLFRGARLIEVIHGDDGERQIVIVTPQRAYVGDGQEWTEGEGLDHIQRWGGFDRVVFTDGETPTIYAIGREWDYGEAWGAVGVLYRSTDLGLSFDTIARFGRDLLSDVAPIPGSDDAYVMLADTLMMVGPEGGLRRKVAPFELEGGYQGVTRLNLRVGSAEILVLHVTRGDEYAIQISGDSGATWSRTAEAPSGLFWRSSFAIDPHDPSFLVIGGINAYYSRDAGYTWTLVNKWGEYYANPETKLHADLPYFRFVDLPGEERTILISTDGGLYRSDDALASVRNVSLSGLGNSQYYSVYTSRADTSRIFAGAQDQGFQRSVGAEEGMLDFDQTISGDYGQIASGDSGRSIWTNYPGFAMYYPDALKESLGWGVSANFPTEGHLWIPPLMVDPDNREVAWVAGGGTEEAPGARLMRFEHVAGENDLRVEIDSVDFGEGDTKVKMTAITHSPVDADRWYAITSNGRFWRSVDRGRTWSSPTEWSVPKGHYFYGNVVLPSQTDPETLWVAGSGYSSPGVWVSRDNGTTFDSLNRGLPPTLVYDLDASADGSLLFAATAIGPYLYRADSGRWFDASGGRAPEQTWWSVDYIEENSVARFGTFGRGIWDLRLEKMEPGNVRGGRVAPLLPALTLQVRGEGSQRELVVESSVAGAGSLEIYDREGRRVATLHAGLIEAGVSRFRWDGTSVDGVRLPAGEYFCMVLLGGSVAFDRTGISE